RYARTTVRRHGQQHSQLQGYHPSGQGDPPQAIRVYAGDGERHGRQQRDGEVHRHLVPVGPVMLPIVVTWNHVMVRAGAAPSNEAFHPGPLRTIGLASRRLWLLLAAVLLLCWCPGSLARADDKAAIAIRKDSPLKVSLSALRAASKGIVVSEKPQVERKATDGYEGTDLGRAVVLTSSWFHLYSVRRPATLVFRRRYVDPRETPDLTVEELRL